MGPKATPANRKKKGTRKASTTGRPRRVVTRSHKLLTDMGESFLHQSEHRPDPSFKIAVGNSPVTTVPSHPVTGSTDGVYDTLLQMMGDLTEANKELSQRVVALESHGDKAESTPKVDTNHVPSATQSHPHASNTGLLYPNNHLVTGQQAAAATHYMQATHLTLPQLRADREAEQMATAHIADLEKGTQQTIAGKTHTSGRFNVKSVPLVHPTLRWPNEGIAASGGKRRTGYDDLSIPQWVTGQLANILQALDIDILRLCSNRYIH